MRNTTPLTLGSSNAACKLVTRLSAFSRLFIGNHTTHINQGGIPEPLVALRSSSTNGVNENKIITNNTNVNGLKKIPQRRARAALECQPTGFSSSFQHIILPQPVQPQQVPSIDQPCITPAKTLIGTPGQPGTQLGKTVNRQCRLKRQQPFHRLSTIARHPAMPTISPACTSRWRSRRSVPKGSSEACTVRPGAGGPRRRRLRRAVVLAARQLLADHQACHRGGRLPAPGCTRR